MPSRRTAPSEAPTATTAREPGSPRGAPTTRGLGATPRARTPGTSPGLRSGELGPEDLLVELADAGLRNLRDELDAVGEPPLGEARLEVRAELVGGHRRALLHDDESHGPLAPFRVGHADHRRLEHRRVRHQCVLQLDRGDPLAAGLDDVLRAVGELEVPVFVDGPDVAGAEPSVLEPVLGARRV